MAKSKIPQSQAYDVQSHHSSPEPHDEQTDPFGKLPRNVPRGSGSKRKAPPHKTKHSEPVGRPKNKRY